MEIIANERRTLVTDRISGTEESIVFTVSVETKNWTLHELQTAALDRAMELLREQLSHRKGC